MTLTYDDEARTDLLQSTLITQNQTYNKPVLSSSTHVLRDPTREFTNQPPILIE